MVYSIIQFCQKELQAEDLSDDAKESLEVASQCLQSAYALNTEDKHLEVSKSLPTIFQEATKNEPVRPHLAHNIFISSVFPTSCIRNLPHQQLTRRRLRG